MRFKVAINQQQAHPVIHLTDTNTDCTAEIFAFGGLLNAFHIPMNGILFNCIDGFESVKQAEEKITNAFKSAKISPFVCRLQNGTYSYNGQSHKIHKNYLGNHALHGLIYDAVYELGNITQSEEAAAISMTYQYQKNDPGYPFEYTIRLHWELRANNYLSVTTSISHQNDGPITYADGWQPYFTLGGPVDQYQLQFDANTQLEFDEALIPTGKKLKDTRFEQKNSLANIFLDNSFELAPNGKCVLSNNGLQLEIVPDQHYSILQVYTPPHRNSIAIENLTGAPDNFNNGIGLLMLFPKKQNQIKTN